MKTREKIRKNVLPFEEMTGSMAEVLDILPKL